MVDWKGNRRPPKGPGVYIIHQSGRLVYIGQSVNLSNRLRPGEHEHLDRVLTEGKPWTIRYVLCDVEVLDHVESLMIQKYRPEWNVKKEPVPDVLPGSDPVPQLGPVDAWIGRHPVLAFLALMWLFLLSITVLR